MNKQGRERRATLRAIITRFKHVFPGNCFYCGIVLNRATASRDHVTPRSRGGANEEYNLVMACRTCNTEKGALTIQEYRAIKGGGQFFGEKAISIISAIGDGSFPLSIWTPQVVEADDCNGIAVGYRPGEIVVSGKSVMSE